MTNEQLRFLFAWYFSFVEGKMKLHKPIHYATVSNISGVKVKDFAEALRTMYISGDSAAMDEDAIFYFYGKKGFENLKVVFNVVASSIGSGDTNNTEILFYVDDTVTPTPWTAPNHPPYLDEEVTALRQLLRLP